ncbi:hypothetical protein ACFLV7_10695 [Chloroflexota bacterium]
MNRLLLVFILIVLIVTLFSCNQQKPAIVQIIQIVDHHSNQPINQVDISISPGEISGRDENDLYEWDLRYPINVPIEVGKCTYILIEALGYHDWEEAFCPQKAKRIDVEISLVQNYLPLLNCKKPNIFVSQVELII